MLPTNQQILTNNNVIHKMIFVVIAIGLSACGSPQEEYSKAIEDAGYIAYTSPLSSVGVGTIIKGSPEAMRVATRPEQCFPNKSNEGGPTGLRWVTDTNLPSVYKTFQLDFGVDLSDILTGGNFLLSLNLGYTNAKQVQIKFDGASIEYLDEFSFYYYYTTMMSGFCKQLLSESPFILQALRIEKMSFKFFESNGAQVRISPGMIGEILNIGVGTSWKIQNNYELIVDSPKYVGYQVGFMDANNPGRIGYLAHTLSGNEFNFEAVNEVPIPGVKTNDSLITDNSSLD